jgi:hypothetical protein
MTKSESAMTEPQPGAAGAGNALRRLWSQITCAALLVLFGGLSYSAVLTKSATFDEPLHLVGGFVHRDLQDYRIDPEDPALLGAWAALPHGRGAMVLNPKSRAFQESAERVGSEWPFATETLYHTPANRADSILNTSRAMFTLLGIATGAMIAIWSWKLGGAVAAVVATFGFTFDPNFLAHASLVKNDVMLSLVTLAMAVAVWSFGRDGALWKLLAVGLLCGAGMNVKFSGMILAPTACLMLLVRAVMPQSWPLLGMELRTIASRLLAVGVSCVVVMLLCWAVTWAVYGFRFAPTPLGTMLNTEHYQNVARFRELWARQGKQPTPDEALAQEGGLLPRAIQRLEEEELMPQAWLFGLLQTYAFALIRGCYLMGERRLTGWWYYFPMAMLFKTPIATLIAMFGAILGALLVTPLKLRHRPADADRRWAIACLLIPPAVYAMSAISANLNLGIRHILPVYPFIYIGLGLAAARLLQAPSAWPKAALAVLGVALAVESVSAWPNYIPFFNLACGRAGGGLGLLGDSNLDWGQDLPALAKWQAAHRDRPLYLSYFCSPPPEYYGIDCTALVGTLRLGTRMHLWDVPASPPAYIAVGATELQAIYLDKAEFAPLRRVQPREVLNGTVYLYDWPLPVPVTAPPAPAPPPASSPRAEP